MSQFEYTDLNKFFVSIGIFLIGSTFLLPWLFFRENFDLLIKSEDLKTYTETAQNIIIQRQSIVSAFPIIILILSSCTFITGVFFFIKGIIDWIKSERLKRETNKLANQIKTQEVQSFSSQEKLSLDNEATLFKSEEIIYSPVDIPINNLWVLNHWGSDVASIEKGKIIFKGKKTRLETDGCHINLKDILKVGSIYKVSCFVKAQPNTTGKFQLWCHDNLGKEPNGTDAAIPYATPSVGGERCSLRFEAKYNTNLRIHLQYYPGQGQIEVSDVKINELKVT
jgi:hypothetical protein